MALPRTPSGGVLYEQNEALSSPFSRFDKLDRSFLGFLSFVAALIWLR
jgi:hypothetical protein